MSHEPILCEHSKIPNTSQLKPYYLIIQWITCLYTHQCCQDDRIYVIGWFSRFGLAEINLVGGEVASFYPLVICVMYSCFKVYLSKTKPQVSDVKPSQTTCEWSILFFLRRHRRNSLILVTCCKAYYTSNNNSHC